MVIDYSNNKARTSRRTSATAVNLGYSPTISDREVKLPGFELVP